MNSTIPLLVGLLLVALLTLVCSCHVEREVLATAEATLADGGHEWASAEVDGRWITLTGYAPTADAQADAVSQVLNTDAVTRVYDNDLVVHEVTDRDVDPVRSSLRDDGLGWVGVERDDRTLELTGVAAEPAEGERAEEIAGPLWPWGPLDNRIRPAGNAADRQLLACRGSLQTLLAQGTVNFETDSAAIAAEGRTLLDQMVSVLDDCEDTVITVEAHSDNTGDAAYNLTLSQSRAESVVSYLISQGLAPERFQARGFGETRPVASNDTPEGRAVNRRVEFRFSL